MSGYRSGFVSIVGCPNAGKSTLLNRLVGQKIAIVSDRAQTTRNKVTGVLTREGYQIVFLDTPGMTRPQNRLGEYMQRWPRTRFPRSRPCCSWRMPYKASVSVTRLLWSACPA